jgi:SAM-dependent methyltransferase
MSPLILAWLMTEEGAALLAAAAHLPADPLPRLTALRRRTTPERAGSVVALLELRQRAQARFPQADALFFTAEGLEQATAASVAHHRASRFAEGVPVLDACCGIGSDAGALAHRAPTLAVDLNPAAAACARANAPLLGGAHPVYALCADVTTLDLPRLAAQGVGAALFDPSRRADRADGSRRRVRDASDYTPPLEFLETLRAHFPALCVKVSPGLDDDALQRFDSRVEFVSDRGECKEAALWFGSLTESLPALSPAAGVLAGDRRYLATVLRAGALPATLAPFACDPPPLSAPRQWILEPDPAVIRAHLVPQVAALTDAALITPGVAYLTADTSINTPFATAYRILDWLPYQEKTVRARLRQLGRRVEVVKKRDVPLEPEQVRKALLDKDRSLPPCVLILTRYHDKITAILCDLPHSAAQESPLPAPK